MAPEKVEELKSRLHSTYDELKKEIKKIKK